MVSKVIWIAPSPYCHNLKQSWYGCDFTTYTYIGCLQPSLKQQVLDQTRQNGYQTVPFGVYIDNLMFAFILEHKCSWNGLGAVVILPLTQLSVTYN